ncbi:MAG: hypothetical protein DRH06_08220, partial [Deltaproteobacteria bacterium]
MKEQGHQSKIIKAIEFNGGVVVNGIYSKDGIADLIAGMPYNIMTRQGNGFKPITILRHIHIEVKSMLDYNALFRNHIEEV